MTRRLLFLPLYLAWAAACAVAHRPASPEFVVGSTVAGRITPADPQFADGSRYQLFRFVGHLGDTITAELESQDFDANLILSDGFGNRIAANDDGGDHCNARLTHILAQSGTYRLYANSAARAELGAFRLVLRRGGASPAPADTVCRGFGRVAGMIQIGQTVDSVLTADDPLLSGDSTYFQRWILPVTPGQTFTVDLVSRDFDAYLILIRGAADKLLENDDGAGACNARLVYTPTDDRPLRVVVNTARKHETGRFVLTVSSGRSATDAKGSCPR